MNSQKINTALNAVCPYFTMFPLEFPYSILKRHSKAGDKVLDPFCGRGTTNYASRLVGLRSAGIDTSSVAVALTEAKVANTSAMPILRAALEILETHGEPVSVPTGEFWEIAYHPRVLQILCRLREGLISDCSTDARRGLRAILLGALHGPTPKTKSSYLSNQCPRTYAPKPRYAVSFWKERGLQPRDVSILTIIAERAIRYFDVKEAAASLSTIVAGNATDRRSFTKIAVDGKFDWTITSPPYYGMTTYVADQWLRNWFVGGPDRVDYSTKTQVSHGSPELFAADLKKVWLNVQRVSNDGARLVIRFGSINNRKAEPRDIIKESLRGTRWRLQTMRSAGAPRKGRRQAESFTTVTTPVDEFDLWARLD
ncbi:MAG: hypothetical protein KIT61_03020 [Pyrinomonadaceae bacterium]|nr:hypothetical protein [Pyrinomonadaceae bacterium]